MKVIHNDANTVNLIDLLFKQDLLTQKQLNDARKKQSKLIGTQKSLQELLLEMGFIKEDDLTKVLSKALNMPVLDLEKEKIDTSAVKSISEKVARRYCLIPIRKEENTLILGMANPNDIIALDDIAALTNMQIESVLMKKSDVLKCIDKYYELSDNLYDILKNMDNGEVEMPEDDELAKGFFALKGNAYKSSVAVRLVNFILNDAIKNRASDIHIEPQKTLVTVRYRIDGNLKSILKFPKTLHMAVVARIKILTKLNIAESKRPQDGRVRVLIHHRKIDLRVAIMPTFHAEKITIRLLDPREARIKLDQIGMQEKELDIFTETLGRPQGMILVTGPTGCGKTSTLYAALNFIKNETKNIVTIEDPIEYLIEDISQTQINPVKDITFANGLRNILRHDPNVILVGEIRDKKGGDIAFRASLTGHLVFSTLHTRSATSSITRLRDMGLDSSVIASSVILIVSQRLVRMNCPHCKEEYTPDKKLLKQYKTYITGLSIKKFVRGKGCKRCNFTGYFGRTSVFEMLEINEAIKELIAKGASENTIFKEAKKNGLKTLVESGIKKVAEQITTLEELARCVDVVEENGRKSHPHISESETSLKSVLQFRTVPQLQP